MSRHALIFLFLLHCLLVADWSDTDSSRLSNIMSNVSSMSYAINQMYAREDQVGWSTFLNNQYLTLNEISDGAVYRWRQSQEGSPSGMQEVDPFSENNMTFFGQNDNAKDNTSYYLDNILSYYPSQYSITVPSTRPEATMFDYPELGNMTLTLGSKLTNAGFGIEDIKQSQQTQELRDKITMIEDKANLMFSDNYDNSVVNWDFSEFGNFFVRSHVMTTNPFVNLKGQIRLKPQEGDFHYNIWHNYFDESYSLTAVVYRTCINVCFYIAFMIYVMNDLMSIVDA